MLYYRNNPTNLTILKLELLCRKTPASLNCLPNNVSTHQQAYQSIKHAHAHAHRRSSEWAMPPCRIQTRKFS